MTKLVRLSREKFMSKTLTKQRWTAWENQCVQKAFKEKVQLKVISLALGRSRTAVRKKINGLGLKSLVSVKRQKLPSTKSQQEVPDLTKMEKILYTYAPSQQFRGGRKVLKKRRHAHSVQQEKCPFTSSVPLDYILSMDHLPKKARTKRVFGDPYYVTFQDMEAWAFSHGFRPLSGGIKYHGVAYWKDGRHFSKVQLLMYVNAIRYERKLQPLALFDDE